MGLCPDKWHKTEEILHTDSICISMELRKSWGMFLSVRSHRQLCLTWVHFACDGVEQVWEGFGTHPYRAANRAFLSIRHEGNPSRG